MTTEERTIQRDRMRFIKNSLSSNLAILGILFDVFYFVSLYQSDVDTYYYNYLIGISIVYNLIFMLAVFLSYKGVKIVRIFIIPMRAHATTTIVNGESVVVMQDGQFFWMVACLAASAACLVISAVVNFIRCNELEAHLKTLETQGV